MALRERAIGPLTLLWPLMGLIFGITPDAHADAVGAAKSAIQAIYAKQEAAAARLDINGQFIGYAPNYIAIEPDGTTLSLAQVRQITQRLFAAVRSASASDTIRKFTLNGKTATVQATVHGTVSILNPQTNQIAQIVTESQGTDTWERSGQSWLLMKSKIASEHNTVNGHPFP